MNDEQREEWIVPESCAGGVRRLSQQEDHLNRLGRQRTKLARLLVGQGQITGGLLASVMSGDYETLRSKFLRSTGFSKLEPKKSFKAVVWAIVFARRLFERRRKVQHESVVELRSRSPVSASSGELIVAPSSSRRRESREKGEMQAKALAAKHPPVLRGIAGDRAPTHAAVCRDELYRSRRENYLRMMKERDDEIIRKRERLRADFDRAFKPLRIAFQTVLKALAKPPRTRLHPLANDHLTAKDPVVAGKLHSQQERRRNSPGSGKRTVGFPHTAKPTSNVLLEPISSPSRF